MKLRSPGGTKIIGVLALVIVAALGWLFVVGPQTSALTDVRTQTTDAQAQTQALQQQLALLQAQQEQLPQTRTTSQALATKFPETADQPGLFEAVAEAVSDAGIPAEDLTALTPTPPVIGGVDPAAGVALPTEGAVGGLATQTVTVSVEATYDQTQQLMANLEQMPRAYLITSLTLTADTETGRFSTTIAGEMFVMPLPQEQGAEVTEPASAAS